MKLNIYVFANERMNLYSQIPKKLTFSDESFAEDFDVMEMMLCIMKWC